MTKYLLLDYDGFICKSHYAAVADGEIDGAVKVLNNLKISAINRGCKFFKDEKEIKVITIVSGHSWKKELYSSYKQSRRKDVYIGLLRDYLAETDDTIIRPELLEADELIVMLHDYLGADNVLVFSDDKDLKYAVKNYCKINLIEEPITQKDFNYNQLFTQMLAGDSEDCVVGIPKVGMTTANKLLLSNGFDIVGVVKSYIDKGIDQEECIKNLNLIIPMCKIFNSNKKDYDLFCGAILTKGEYTRELNTLSKKIQNGQIDYLVHIVNDLYKE